MQGVSRGHSMGRVIYAEQSLLQEERRDNLRSAQRRVTSPNIARLYCQKPRPRAKIVPCARKLQASHVIVVVVRVERG